VSYFTNRPIQTDPGIAFLGLLLLFAAVLMLFFVILGGTGPTSPLNSFYFLSAQTSQIPNADADFVHWTLWNVCREAPNGNNGVCGRSIAGHVLLPQHNFQTAVGVPYDFYE
jgi:hypothetical protein